MASKSTKPAAAKTETVKPAAAKANPAPAKRPAPKGGKVEKPAETAAPTAVTAPAAGPALKVYPPVTSFINQDLADLQAEYAALKAIENPNEAEAARKLVLRDLGREVNKYLQSIGGALPASRPTFDIKAVAAAMNRVIPFDTPISLEQDSAALEAEVRASLTDLALKDFQKGEEETREIFSQEEAAMIQAMGIELPAGALTAPVKKSGKGKTAKGPKAPRTGGIKHVGIVSVIVELATKKAVTKDEIWAELKKRFPERPADGMRSTINCQFSSHLKKKFNVVAKDGKFKLVPLA